jgi:hypothetical protein
MARTRSQRQFTVSAQVHVETTYDIQADNLEDALAKARDLKLLDFVTLSGDYNDGRHDIVCIYETSTAL